MRFVMEGKSLCVDSGVERAELVGAIRDAILQAEPYPNLLVRITVETVNRPVLVKSEWRRRRTSLDLVEVIYLTPYDGVIFRDLKGQELFLGLRDWYGTFEWISNHDQ